jgi:tRNA 2-selenouridine synthase
LPKIIEAHQISELTDALKIIDVRSPKEFSQGHIPGAYNLPLFSNEERALVGTCYKQKGKEPAIKIGLEIVGPKMASFIEDAQKISPNKQILVHCWRGGMRSSSMAWLLELTGFDVSILKGGYKAYRNFALAIFNEDYKLKILGGKTGSGKTQLLHQMNKLGIQIIDLEAIAHHKGSAFGKIGHDAQPTSEQFENNLAMALQTLNAKKKIWLEDESKGIGKCFIPMNFWQKMRLAPLFVVSINDEKRIENLLKDYGNANKEELAEPIKNLEKRLGNEKMKEALKNLEEGDLKAVTKIMLYYYDKTYDYALTQKETKNINLIDCRGLNENQIIEKILSI